MRRMQSAPSARASQTCQASMTKSLRSTGRPLADRASARYRSAPWKNASSVSTDSAAAPPAA